MTSHHIRLARADELEGLRALEVAAGTAFRDIGMDDIADDDPPPVEALEVHRADDRIFVVADAADDPIAYLLLEVLDGNAHVEQVSVHPSAAGQGLGRGLLDHAAAWAAEREHPAVTLTTFRTVPWNAPYYERRCGFRAMEPGELGPELRARMAEEAAHGLDPADRVAMVRPTAVVQSPA